MDAVAGSSLTDVSVDLPEKAPFRGAFFVLAVSLYLSPPLSECLAADCRPPPDTQPLDVARVLDGDTLRLKDGRDIRLIGLDTPELGRDGHPDMFFAREAKVALQQLVESAGGRILLRPGVDPDDRYRRVLGHVYASDGTNLTATLLRQGMGHQAIIAPNLIHLSCYRAAEQEARKRASGLWRKPVREAIALTPEDRGFHLLRGRVLHVGQSRQAVWLNLAGPITVKVPRSVWREMTADEPAAYVERRLEVRGWFYPYRDELRVVVSHPAAIRWLGPNGVGVNRP